MRKSADTVIQPQTDRPFDPGFTGPIDHANDRGYDGRLLRGERTKLHIAEAMIELIEEGSTKPTAKLIAERAGVSLRLVFHHFEDVEAIFREAALIQAGRHWRKVVTIPPTGPVAARIETTIKQRRQLYVAISPVRSLALVRAGEDEGIQKLLVGGRRRLRLELATTFEPELTKAGSNSVIMLDAAEAATSWDTWHSLRTTQRKSIAASQRIMEYSLATLLR